ncbi:unnamed protein product, partial [Candidula unifasciata]
MEPGTCNLKASYSGNIDFSHFPFPKVIVPMVSWEVYVKCVAMAIIILTAVVGNLFIIVIVSSSKAMRTTTNMYIINLAVADLIIACFPTWIFLVKDVNKMWATGGFFCKFNAFIQIQAMCALSFTMVAIAGDRFFAVMYPLKARVTNSKVKYVLVIVWTTAIAVAVPLFVYNKYSERQWANHLEKFCDSVWPMFVLPNGKCDFGETSQMAYYIVVLAALNWFPMAAMTVSYAIIIYRLQWGRDASSFGHNAPVVQRRSTKKVVKLFFVLLIAFIVCTVPFQVTSLYSMIKDPVTVLPGWFQSVYYAAISLMYAHSCVNPLVYGLMSQSFRSGFRHLLT